MMEKPCTRVSVAICSFFGGRRGYSICGTVGRRAAKGSPWFITIAAILDTIVEEEEHCKFAYYRSFARNLDYKRGKV